MIGPKIYAAEWPLTSVEFQKMRIIRCEQAGPLEING